LRIFVLLDFALSLTFFSVMFSPVFAKLLKTI
jgi:hypothetical protein